MVNKVPDEITEWAQICKDNVRQFFESLEKIKKENPDQCYEYVIEENLWQYSYCRSMDHKLRGSDVVWIVIDDPIISNK